MQIGLAAVEGRREIRVCAPGPTTGIEIIPIGVESRETEGSIHRLKGGAGALKGIDFGAGGLDATRHLPNRDRDQNQQHGQHPTGHDQLDKAKCRKAFVAPDCGLPFQGCKPFQSPASHCAVFKMSWLWTVLLLPSAKCRTLTESKLAIPESEVIREGGAARAVVATKIVLALLEYC